MFDGLPLKERLFVRGRLATAPLEALAARAEGARLLDVGCGHGVLVAPLARGYPPGRKSVVEGKSVDLGCRRIIKKKTRASAALIV